MITRLIIILVLTLAPMSLAAQDQPLRDRVVTILRDDGFAEIRVTRTFLGRLRFVARDDNRRREIVINPRTGVILRDYIRFEDDGDDNGDGGGCRFE